MGKKKNSERSLFRDSVDPRFNGVFNSSIVGNSSIAAQSSMNVEITTTDPKVRKNEGFQNFLSRKLNEYLESHIKEVDRPVLEPDFFSNKLESIKLFSDSDAITEEKSVESTEIRVVKKKRKKERSDKELLKEVAVSYDWLQRQAQIFNS